MVHVTRGKNSSNFRRQFLITTLTVKMLRITDAQRTKIVSVPAELAQHIGVFRDMIDTVPTPEGDSGVEELREDQREHYISMSGSCRNLDEM